MYYFTLLTDAELVIIFQVSFLNLELKCYFT